MITKTTPTAHIAICSKNLVLAPRYSYLILVEGEGFEPSKAEPSDLQSDPFGHSGTPPLSKLRIVFKHISAVNEQSGIFAGNWAISAGESKAGVVRHKRNCPEQPPDVRFTVEFWCRQRDSNPRPTDYKSVFCCIHRIPATTLCYFYPYMQALFTTHKFYVLLSLVVTHW